MNPENRIVPIVTCEHASNEVPEAYESLFHSADNVLASHRGWDPGAEVLARTIAGEMCVTPHLYPFTRLLIEPNRSVSHPNLFSEYSSHLSFSEKKELIKQYYLPYRMCIAENIQEILQKGYTVLHISVHTFTPVLLYKERNFDIGFLYDPGRNKERQISFQLKKLVLSQLPKFKIRMNQPYKGISDGLTTMLRNEIDKENYIGIEVEVNQKHTMNSLYWREICAKIAVTVKNLIRCVE